MGFGEVSGEVLGGFCQGFWEVWVEGFETLNAHKLLLIVLIEIDKIVMKILKIENVKIQKSFMYI